MFTASGKLIFYQERAGKVELEKWIATELGSILNVKKLWLQALHAEFHMGAAMGFQPFDLAGWLLSDDYVEPTLAGLADALNVSCKRLTQQYLAARPAVQRLLDAGHRDISHMWRDAIRRMERARTKCPELRTMVVAMLASMPGTGGLESNLSSLQAMHSHRQAGGSIEQVRCHLKIALDGPHPNKFIGMKNGADGAPPVYTASHLAARVEALLATCGAGWWRCLSPTRTRPSPLSDCHWWRCLCPTWTRPSRRRPTWRPTCACAVACRVCPQLASPFICKQA